MRTVSRPLPPGLPTLAAPPAGVRLHLYGLRSYVAGGFGHGRRDGLRHFLPESPRWLMTHGQPEEAERVVREIERRIEHETGKPCRRCRTRR